MKRQLIAYAIIGSIAAAVLIVSELGKTSHPRKVHAIARQAIVAEFGHKANELTERSPFDAQEIIAGDYYQVIKLTPIGWAILFEAGPTHELQEKFNLACEADDTLRAKVVEQLRIRFAVRNDLKGYHQ